MTIADEADVTRLYNPFEPTQAENPYPVFELARRQQPVFFSPAMKWWVVTRAEDVNAVLKDNTKFSFSNSQGYGQISQRAPQAEAIMNRLKLAAQNSEDGNNPPAHTHWRAALNKSFSARRVAQMEPMIRQLAHNLIDTMLERHQAGTELPNRANLVAKFAYTIPISVIFNLVGIPQADWEMAGRGCGDWFRYYFFPLSEEEQIQAAQNVARYEEYMLDFVAQRRARPQDDFASDLIKAADEGEAKISEQRILNTLAIALAAAGHETTVNLIGTSLYYLLRPEGRHYWDSIESQPDLLGKLVEETLRLEGPALGLVRLTKEDVEIGGVKIPAGALVWLSLASANRDETEFADSNSFEPERDKVSNHSGFGKGIHFCLGAPLARLESRLAIEVLRQRLPQIELVREQVFTHLPSPSLRGLRQLWAEW